MPQDELSMTADAPGHVASTEGLGGSVNEATEAARLAHRMAKAAGPRKARVMAQACYMLLCTAALVADPDGYFEWLEKHHENR